MPSKPPLLMITTVSRLQFRNQRADDGIGRLNTRDGVALALATDSRSQSTPGGWIPQHLVGIARTSRQALAMHPEAHGIRSRLDHRDDPATRLRRAQALQRSLRSPSDDARNHRRHALRQYTRAARGAASRPEITQSGGTALERNSHRFGKPAAASALLTL
jgi:hypothetical protein